MSPLHDMNWNTKWISDKLFYGFLAAAALILFLVGKYDLAVGAILIALFNGVFNLIFGVKADSEEGK